MEVGLKKAASQNRIKQRSARRSFESQFGGGVHQRGVPARTRPPRPCVALLLADEASDVVEAAGVAHERRQVLLDHERDLAQVRYVVGGPLMGDVTHADFADLVV